MSAALDLSSLQKAIAQLDEAIAFSRSDLAGANPRLAVHLRAAAIQAFEFTYELSIKTLKRFLEATEANPSAVEEMSFNELIRRGYELGLLQAEMAAWRAFRRDRGTTSQTYDEAKALIVFEAIPAFATEAKFLFAQIRERQERIG
jgi:nucleotidyltransferase substrate binding protein (TIGR01987 family)